MTQRDATDHSTGVAAPSFEQNLEGPMEPPSTRGRVVTEVATAGLHVDWAQSPQPGNSRSPR